MGEEYNGYTNRETWALGLHLSNDQGLDEMAREGVAALLSRPGQAIEMLVAELFDRDGDFAGAPEVEAMRDEVGSLWRVDWDEVAEGFLPEDES